ncbi:MAG TPA: CBS domain-containing protein [Nitrososphaeraceae archaeon]|jgi:signal-transduction protein with cAMP-binding, CBS, and nucleotidyltransferase domain|nr:CBS domain-containing protein [Nitrososphaeraceae archaeon]
MTTIVSDLMRKNVFTIEESVSIQNSAKEMKDKKVSSLLVNCLLLIETLNPQVKSLNMISLEMYV